MRGATGPGGQPWKLCHYRPLTPGKLRFYQGFPNPCPLFFLRKKPHKRDNHPIVQIWSGFRVHL